jgi:CHAD domain-containing protein
MPDKMLCELAHGFLREQAEVLADHVEAAQGRQDSEPVHQVRVACRRMRAGLAFFGDCFDDDKAARWRRQLKKMLRRFGPARDCDVQIEWLQHTLDGMDENDKKTRPGIARLLLRLRQQRDALQQGLDKAVRRLQRERFTMNLHLETERLLYEVQHAEEQADTVRFYDRAAEQVRERLDEVFKKLSSLDDAADHTGHHALRIAVKKLRYTLELCDRALDGRLKKGIKRLKKFQTFLGNLHDCDVWEAQIDAFIAEETERTAAYYGHARPMSRLLPGLRWLQTQRRQDRQCLFEATVLFAAELETNEFWTRLAEAVKEDAAPADNGEDRDDEGDTDGGQ